jgi:hypothetical protein
MVAVLVWAKMGLAHKNLAALLSIKKAKLTHTINHIHGPLYTSLSQKWWENCMCPIPVPDTTYPYIALLIDSTTVETC